jgi:hypothetical protein
MVPFSSKEPDFGQKRVASVRIDGFRGQKMAKNGRFCLPISTHASFSSNSLQTTYTTTPKAKK